MHKGIIFTKNMNQVVPEEALKVFLGKYPSCQGAAVVLKSATEGGPNEMQMISKPEAAVLEGLQDVQDVFTEDLVVFYLGNSTDKVVSNESLQPFTLVTDDEGKPVLAGFITGFFPGYKEEKSVHSDAFFVVEKYLRIKLNKLYNMAGKDTRKFLDELRDPMFKQEMNNLFVGDGQVTLLSITGEILTFSDKNSKIKLYDWGMCSDPEGYEAKGMVPAGTVAQPKKSLGATVASAVKHVLQPGKQTATEETKPGTTTGGETTIKTDVFKGKMVQAPRDLKGKAIKKYYSRNAGFCPPDWHTYPEVESRVYSALSDLPATLPEGVQKTEAETRPVNQPQKTKDTTVHNKAIEQNALPLTSQLTEVVPIIPKVEKDHLKELMDKGILIRTLDNNSQEIPDPDSLQKAEAKFPSFCKQNNIPSMDVTKYWSFTNVLEYVAQRDPVAITKLWADTRAKWLEAEKHLEQLTAPKVEETKPIQTTQTQKDVKKSSVIQPQRKLAM